MIVSFDLRESNCVCPARESLRSLFPFRLPQFVCALSLSPCALVQFTLHRNVSCSLLTEHRERTARRQGGQVPSGSCLVQVNTLSHWLFTVHLVGALEQCTAGGIRHRVMSTRALWTDPEPGGRVHPRAQPGHADPAARPLVCNHCLLLNMQLVYIRVRNVNSTKDRTVSLSFCYGVSERFHYYVSTITFALRQFH